jgi:MFS transporter, putative metabolite:H+ symporter
MPPPPREAPVSTTRPKLTPYQRRLFVFLGVATFFEGYDMVALTQILPHLRVDMGLEKQVATTLVGVINFGTLLAYLLVRKADTWGRRRVLTVTIVGYTLFTLLSGLAPNVWWFAVAQMLARIFLIGEWAISMVIAAEEFPADRRGFVIGIIQAFSTFGGVVCAALVPVLVSTPWGWRTVYFVGVLPLLILAYARRGLRESERFTEQAARTAGAPPVPLMEELLLVFRTPYWRRTVQLGVIWLLAYIASHNAVTFWKDWALTERGLSDAHAARLIAVGAIAAMPLVFYVGKVNDWLGRRPGAVIVGVLCALGLVGSFTAPTGILLQASVVLGIFATSAFLPVLNAYTTELFPTHLRGSAYAWSNTIIGRLGYVLSPFALGPFVAVYGWGGTIPWLGVFPLAAAGLVLLWLPETRGRELEETSQL